MEGSASLQKQYIEDLARIAVKDDYLFVVWFLVIDYDALYKKLPEGDGSNRIWRNIGFLDAKLEPKPAWDSWQSIVHGDREKLTAEAAFSESETKKRTSDASSVSKLQVGFGRKSDLFQSPDQVTLTDEAPPGADGSMKWSFDYKGQWHWATKPLKAGRVDGLTHVSFWIKSDRGTPMFFQIEEQDGEAFFEMVFVGTEWKEIHFELDALRVDPEKKRDGRLDPSKISQILIADNAGAEKAKGKRTIWLSDLGFYASK
jgi:hypothetical protein